MIKSLLHALGMPFQLPSLLFVLVCALILGVTFSVASATAGLAISLLAIVVVLIWVVQYAYVVLDAAANGLPELPAAAADLLSPFADERGWLHPAIIATTYAVLMLNPDLPRWPIVLGVALFFPPSIGATAISGKALDALNPFAITRVIVAMGSLYALPVGVFLLCTAGCVLLGAANFWLFPRLVGMALLLLLAYASVGAVLFVRRQELGFEPRVSPERKENEAAALRLQQRQEWIDALYQLVLVRDHPRAATLARHWLGNAATHELPGDITALLAAGRSWRQQHSYCQLLRSIVLQLLELQRVALALQVTEAGLAQAPEFALADETATVAVARYALQTSRRKLAATILDNHAAVTGNANPGVALAALREQLRQT